MVARPTLYAGGPAHTPRRRGYGGAPIPRRLRGLGKLGKPGAARAHRGSRLSGRPERGLDRRQEGPRVPARRDMPPLGSARDDPGLRAQRFPGRLMHERVSPVEAGPLGPCARVLRSIENADRRVSPRPLLAPNPRALRRSEGDARAWAPRELGGARPRGIPGARRIGRSTAESEVASELPAWWAPRRPAGPTPTPASPWGPRVDRTRRGRRAPRRGLRAASGARGPQMSIDSEHLEAARGARIAPGGRRRPNLGSPRAPGDAREIQDEGVSATPGRDGRSSGDPGHRGRSWTACITGRT